VSRYRTLADKAVVLAGQLSVLAEGSHANDRVWASVVEAAKRVGVVASDLQATADLVDVEVAIATTTLGSFPAMKRARNAKRVR
jgi:hypothetical protein